MENLHLITVESKRRVTVTEAKEVLAFSDKEIRLKLKVTQSPSTTSWSPFLPEEGFFVSTPIVLQGNNNTYNRLSPKDSRGRLSLQCVRSFSVSFFIKEKRSFFTGGASPSPTASV